MLRISSAVAVGLALICAFVLYSVSYDTRELDSGVQAQERRIERLRSDIAVLRAELAFLSRPERIEPAARALGFAPATGLQYEQPPPQVAQARDVHKASASSAEIAPIQTIEQLLTRTNP